MLMNFLKYFIFKVLYLLKMCPIFVGSVHNFCKSDDDTLFSEKVLIFARCISGLMPNLIKKSWTDSKGQLISKGFSGLFD